VKGLIKVVNTVKTLLMRSVAIAMTLVVVSSSLAVALAVIEAPSHSASAATTYEFATYNGSSWSLTGNNFAGDGITGDHWDGGSCLSSSFCWDQSFYGDGSFYNGSSWSTPVNPFAGVGSSGIAVHLFNCLSTSFCWAGSSNGYFATYNGSTWSTPVLLSDTWYTCLSSSFCWAYSQSTGTYATYDGTSWSSASNPFASDGITGDEIAAVYSTSMKCLSSTFCTAQSTHGYVAAFTGSSWTLSSTSYNSGVSIDCLSSSFCSATADNGDAAFFDGSAWSTPSNPFASVGSYVGGASGYVACASATMCVTIAYNSYYVATYNGYGWSTPTTVHSDYAVGVECGAFSVCFLQLGGGMSFFNGSTWSAEVDPFGGSGHTGDTPLTFSCPTVSICIAQSHDGGASIYLGSGWSVGTYPFAGSGDSASYFRCASSSLCWGRSTLGYFSLFNGSGWSTEEQPIPHESYAPGFGLDATCLSTSFCWAYPNVDPLTAIERGAHLATGHSSKHHPGCTNGKYPVDCASGDFWHSFTDVSIPGPGANLDLTRTYNSLNASIMGMFGYGWSSSYDTNLAVTASGYTITEDDGSQVTAQPNGSGGFVLPSWSDSTLTESGGNYTFIRQHTMKYIFNSSGQVTSIADLNGDTTTLAYTSGKLHTVTDPAGRTITFAYGSNGLVSSATDPLGRVTDYGYDSSHNLLTSTDPLGHVTSFTYDTGGNHLVLTMTLPNGQSGGPDAGHSVVNTYDSSGRVLTQTDPQGFDTTYAYAGDNFLSDGGTTTITDPHGKVEVEGYTDGKLTYVTKGYGTPSAATTNYAYDSASMGTTSITDANGNTTSATFDSDGNQLTSTNGLGNAWTYSYNSLDEQTCAAAPEAASPCSALSPPSAISAGGTITPPSSVPPAHVTYTEYDTIGNKIWTSTGVYQPGSSTASYQSNTYDLYNGESVTLSGTSHSCTTSAPSTSLPCASITPNGTVTQLTYSSQGDLISSSTPDGNSGGQVAKTSYSYDSDGEQITTVAPNGNLSGANAANFTTSKSYNDDSELTSVTVGGVSGSTVVPRTTSYTYDGDRNRTVTSHSSSISYVGSASGSNSTTSLSLSLPAGTRPGDQAVLATTTVSPSSTSKIQHYTANHAYLVAGTPQVGGNGPSGLQANESGLSYTSGVAVDAQGNTYVASINNSNVEEIAATSHTQWGQSMTAGDAYIVAGASDGTSGTFGDGGAATSALLNSPTGIALDSSGDLYIGDAGNNRVQEVAAATGTQWGQSMTAGDIYTVAGDASGSLGYSGDGGPATSAQLWGLYNATGIAIDAGGDLYIADAGNNAVREVAASTGTQWGQSMTANDIYTVAGGAYGSSGDGGAATSSDLNTPYGVAVDAGGDLFVADSGNDRVQEVPVTTGTQWGQSMTANDIYTVVGDPSGSSGTSSDGTLATSALLNAPDTVTFDSAGDLYVADTNNNRVEEVPAFTGTQWGQSMTDYHAYTVAGDSGGSSGSSGDGAVATSATFNGPNGLAFAPSGDLYIADESNSTLRMVAATSESVYPGGVNSIYMVAGNANNVGNTSGDGGPASPAAGLFYPTAEVVGSAGNLYIADQWNNRIQEVPAASGTQWGQSMLAGYMYTIAGDAAGSSGMSGNGGPATSALLNNPSALAVDSAGNLYIADTLNNRIQELAVASGTQWGQSMTAGDIYTVAGDAGGAFGSSGDGGAATSAELRYPGGLTLDASGDLLVSDSDSHAVREVAASTHSQWGQSMTANDIYTIAGDGSSGTSGNGGAATSAELNYPLGLAVDPTGNLFIADQNNNRIQEVAASSHTQWGQSMTANDVYTVAGDAGGSSGSSGIGGAATSTELNGPTDVAVDTSGNLYIDDANNQLVDEVPVTSGSQWGQSMTTGHVYAVAGGGTGGDGALAINVGLYYPQGISLDSAGNLFIADSANFRIREVIAPQSTPQTVTAPSGWTLASTKSSGATTTDVYTHTLSSSDSGVTLSYGVAAPKVASLAVYRGVNSTSPVDASGTGSTTSGTSVSAASVTTTHPGDQLVYVGGGTGLGAGPTWSAPSGMTTRTGADTAGVSEILADGSGPIPAGATGATSTTSSSSGALTAVDVALSPGSVTSTTAYNANDLPTLSTDPDGNATLTCYDGNDKVAQTVPPVGVAANSLTPASCATGSSSYAPLRMATDATTYAYNVLGEPTEVTTPDPAGDPGLAGYQVTSSTYDPAGRLTDTTAPSNSTSPTAYGGAGNDTVYIYDAAGHVLTTTTGAYGGTDATTSNCYDPDGNKTASVAADGNTSSVALCSGSSPYRTSSSYQTAYSYDSAGELVSKTAPATTWASSGQTTTYSYDANGNQLTSEDPNGITTTNTFSSLNQLSGVSYSGSSAPSVGYTYDANGNRVQMTDGTGTSSYTYDAFDEMTSSQNGAGRTVDYAYDSLGNVTGTTYPLGSGATWAPSSTVTYGYDAASQMTSVTDFNGNSVNVSNTADGLPSSMVLGGSGDSISTTYSPEDSPSAISLSNSSTTLLGFSYSDEPSGGIASESGTPSSSLSPASYSYDAQGRVTQMTPGSTSAKSYSEDASGNLTTIPTGATASYDNASELTSSTLSGTTTNYTYDAAGNRTQASVGGSTTATGTYNGANEATGLSDSAANMTAATYDGNGVRATATATPTGGSSATQHFVWDSSGSNPQLLMDSTNAYIYGPAATPIEQVNLSSGTVNYLLSDALGSVRGVVAASGSLVASTNYDAWGNPESTGGLTSYTPVGFAGGYTDPSGLVYLIHRYYDPTTGQFIGVDPLVSQTGQPFSYAGNDPVNNSDPLGLCSVWNPFASGSCFKSGWDSMSGKAQLADATLPITLPLTVLAAVTGVGALAGVGVLGASEGATAGLAFGSGVAATGGNLAECLGLNDKAACIGAGIGSVGLGGVGLGFALGGETIGGGLASAFGFSIAGAGSVWDLLSHFLAFEGASSSASSSCAPRK